MQAIARRFGVARGIEGVGQFGYNCDIQVQAGSRRRLA